VSTTAVLQPACGGGDNEWQRILTAISKRIKKDRMLFSFGAGDGDGWDDLSAERAAEMINHLPPSIEGLWIHFAPYGSSLFMDTVIDWIEKKSTNLKYLDIQYTCVLVLVEGMWMKVEMQASNCQDTGSHQEHNQITLVVLY